MQKLGKDITPAEVILMIKTHDKTGDGMLSFHEFKSIFFEGKELEGDIIAPFGEDGPVVE
jgi:Ca2+-binding EF-hand superfamily protein